MYYIVQISFLEGKVKDTMFEISEWLKISETGEKY